MVSPGTNIQPEQFPVWRYLVSHPEPGPPGRLKLPLVGTAPATQKIIGPESDALRPISYTTCNVVANRRSYACYFLRSTESAAEKRIRGILCWQTEHLPILIHIPAPRGRSY